MADQLYTYSLIKALYDEGKDYVDSFWPLLLVSLPSNRSFSHIAQTQRTIEEKYGLSIPQHSLDAIIDRALQGGFVQRKGKQCALTEAGSKYLNKLEAVQDVARRMNELIEDAQRYLTEAHRRKLSVEEVNKLILAFIKEHIEFFREFISSDNVITPTTRETPPNLKDLDQCLLEYFHFIKRAKPNIYSTLRDLVCGSIISVIIHARSFSEARKKFKPITVYFDTNYVFSILGLHFEEYEKPAQELFELLKLEAGFSFKVFDFTIEEIVGVLRGYVQEQHLYLPHIRVYSIYSCLKVKGFSPSAVRELIAHIDEKLLSMGIGIEATEVDLQKYEPLDPEARARMLMYKAEQNQWGRSHDLACIDQVSGLRGSPPPRRLENARAIFLTSDKRLAQYNYYGCRHKERGTIAEVILDKVLTNILWLKNPTLLRQMPLDSIIAIHSRDLFMERNVWRKFGEIVQELRQKGDLTDREVSVLVYDRNVESALRALHREQVEQIDKKWVLRAAQEAKNRSDEQQVAELERQKVLFQSTLSAEQVKLERRVVEAIEDKKREIRVSTKQFVKRLMLMIRFLCALIVMLLGWQLMPLVVWLWSDIEPIAWLVTVVLAVLGFRCKPKFLFASFRGWLFDKLYERRLSRAHLDELAERILSKK